jgi:soluble lytic murein transglycosylase-like protein
VHIEEAATQHGVSLELVRAIIQVGSGFDRLAVSSAGAHGLMQLMPATARRFGVLNRFDARQNIFGGTRYLRALLDHYQGDVSLTVAAYNAGASCVARYHGIPPYPQTQDYVRKVTTILGAALEEAAAREGRGGAQS